MTTVVDVGGGARSLLATLLDEYEMFNRALAELRSDERQRILGARAWSIGQPRRLNHATLPRRRSGVTVLEPSADERGSWHLRRGTRNRWREMGGLTQFPRRTRIVVLALNR